MLPSLSAYPFISIWDVKTVSSGSSVIVNLAASSPYCKFSELLLFGIAITAFESWLEPSSLFATTL